MKKDDLELENLNAFISKSMTGHNLDYSKILVFDSDKKISVVGNYISNSPYAIGTSRGYWTLNADLQERPLTEGEKYYYGVSPIFDSREIISLISENTITTEEQLDRYISGHADWFMTDERFSNRLLDFSRYLVVSSCRQYGIKIRMDKSDAVAIMDNLASFQDCLKYDDGALWVYGLPTCEVLNELDSRGSYCYSDSGNVKLVKSGGLSIEQIYKARSNIVLLGGRVFYSGVLLKPTSINRIDDLYENDGIVSFSIAFEMSTYATVFSLDADYTTHPLLDSCRDSIREMLSADDDAKQALFEAIKVADTSEILIEKVNDYLKRSCNVNQICVSASLMSSDSYLVLGRRGGKNIDASMYYPSVNGNAEIADNNVSFYKTSVFEDFPTIRCDDYRVDFAGEISRETYGELGLDIDERSWSCLGVCMSGNVPKRSESGEFLLGMKRRMHFNIVFEKEVDTCFLDIQSRQMSAAEKFENSAIRGVKFSLYNDRAERRRQLLPMYLSWISDNQDALESGLLILLAIGCLLGGAAISFNSVVDTIYDSLSFVIAVLVVIAAIIAFRSSRKAYCRLRQSTDETVIYRNEPCEKLFSAIKDAFHESDYHPAAISTATMFWANRASREFFSEKTPV